MALQADLRAPTAAESAVRAAVERWGAVDFLVHLVGAYRSGMRLEDRTDEFWDEMLDVNLRTAVNMMRAVIPSMRQQSSVAALCEVVRVAAAELRDEGITVNAILPSTIATTFVRERYGEVEAHKWVDPRSHRPVDALALLRRRARCDVRVDPVHRPSVPSLLPLARCHRLRAVISGKIAAFH
jgi:NAD(P)-dependent dehydrogenase (short-subunit alcohol dehydrogenase family)